MPGLKTIIKITTISIACLSIIFYVMSIEIPNSTTLFVEIWFAILITAIVAIKSKQSETKLKEITEKVKEATEKIKEVVEAEEKKAKKREDISLEKLQSSLSILRDHFIITSDLINRFNTNKTTNKNNSEAILSKEQIRNSLINSLSSTINIVSHNIPANITKSALDITEWSNRCKITEENNQFKLECYQTVMNLISKLEKEILDTRKEIK